MDTPLCPDCGGPMQVRVARRGRNRGNQFWGCTSFPKCKGTRPLDDVGSPTDIPSDEPAHTLDGPERLPRNVSARPPRAELQCRFIEGVAVPDDALQAFLDGSPDSAILQAYGQWALYYPVGSERSHAEIADTMLAVLEKIVSRGHLTLASPNVEDTLRNSHGFPESDNAWLEALEIAALMPVPQTARTWFDSQEEERFYGAVLPELAGQHSLSWTTPQVEVTSLIGPSRPDYAGQRVDFLIAHPLGTPVVVEVDGAQHERTEESDEERDQALADAGYAVRRIPAAEVSAGSGSNIDGLAVSLGYLPSLWDRVELDDTTEVLLASRTAHQLQVAIVQAVRSGLVRVDSDEPWKVLVTGDDGGDTGLPVEVLQSAAVDLCRLMGRLASLYGLTDCPPSIDILLSVVASAPPDFVVAYGNSPPEMTALGLRTLTVGPAYFPFPVAGRLASARPLSIRSPKREDVEFLSHYIFRYSEFWEGQWEALERVLSGRDTVLLLPTGGGKSLVFQLASLLLPGVCISVVPIISLMDDQVANLSSFGVDRAVGVSSQMCSVWLREKVLALLASGEYLFCYVAPERFQMASFRETLRELTQHVPVSCVAIDECHCVSEWGHDFRPAYLNLASTAREYCRSFGRVPPVLALTGTASRMILKDVQRELGIQEFDATVTPSNWDREELEFAVIHCKSDEKLPVLLGHLHSLPGKFGLEPSTFFAPSGKGTNCGLVFCPWANGEFGTTQIAPALAERLGIAVRSYSGKPPKRRDQQEWNVLKRETARNFKRNSVPLLACTSAFGMGIDKPNIRYTVHYGLPPSMEALYQQAGRAGRDRRRAVCCILVSNDDPQRTAKLLDPRTPPEDIATVLDSTKRPEGDDITRSLFFHVGSFVGVDQEREVARHVLGQLQWDGTRRRVELRFRDEDERQRMEKALHRFLIVGVVADYTVDYSARRISVELSVSSEEAIIDKYVAYVAAYHPGRAEEEGRKARNHIGRSPTEFALGVVGELISFIYDIIEKGRRRSMMEVVLACPDGATDEQIRSRIVTYLGSTEYTHRLDALIASTSHGGLLDAAELLDEIAAPPDAMRLRGEVSRLLGERPDHPGLLLLRAGTELLSTDRDADTAVTNWRAAIRYALDRYSVDAPVILEACGRTAAKVQEADGPAARRLIAVCISESGVNREALRRWHGQVSPSLRDEVAWALLRQLSARCSQLLVKA